MACHVPERRQSTEHIRGNDDVQVRNRECGHHGMRGREHSGALSTCMEHGFLRGHVAQGRAGTNASRRSGDGKRGPNAATEQTAVSGGQTARCAGVRKPSVSDSNHVHWRSGSVDREGGIG